MAKDEFYHLTWSDYGLLVEDLWKDLNNKLSENNIKIDAIVAILREGGFTALPLAYKLNTYRILTIQYKYILNEGGNELKYIAGLPEAEYDITQNPTFLLCDTFPCGGDTKFLAIDRIKENYPGAKFVFASLVQDSSVDGHEDIITSAYAFDVNDSWETTHSLFKKYGIEKNALNVYLPWENKEEEMAAVNQKQWTYE